jgi:hypothetical protein
MRILKAATFFALLVAVLLTGCRAAGVGDAEAAKAAELDGSIQPCASLPAQSILGP